MCQLPSYITHYYDEESSLLRNVCSQPDDIAEEFLSHLKENGKRTWLHPGYLEERRSVRILEILLE